MNVHCKRCRKNRQISHCIMKMGGLICSACRLILIWPNDDRFRKEYKKRSEIHKND